MNTQSMSRPSLLPKLLIQALFAAIALVSTGQCIAASQLHNCYDLPGLKAPETAEGKVLHVLVDQTMALTSPMKASLTDLVTQWGMHGERVTISRFSANIKGQYSELVFDETGNLPPSEAYLYQLRRKDKKALLDCLEKSKTDFHDKLVTVLTTTLNRNNDKLPKSNILHSLNDFASQVVRFDETKDITLLLVSDGLENSDVFSFHERNKIRLINPVKMMSMVRGRGLVPNWQGAKVYFFGLGYISNEKFYARPNILKPLKKFWARYFSEGHAVIQENSIGTPMLLTKSIL